MPTYSSWTVSGGSIDYVPIEKPVNETVQLFNGTKQGSVPPTTNLSSNTGQYILAQDGTWIPQPSFTSGGSDAFEILRPSVFTPTYSAYTPTVTNSSYAYDVDTNHSTTFGEWEFFFTDKATSITDTLVFSSFGAKTQTWTSATINISRAYGYFNDGESSNTTTRATSVKVEFSTDNGSTWTTIVTDLSTSVPSIATTSSYTFTTTPTMGNIKVRLTVVRGGGGTIYNPLGFPKNIPGSTGDADLHIYDIWISGTYSGGSGNITCNNLTVTGDATFQSKIYDSTASAGTTGQVLKVLSNGKVGWQTDTVGTGTVTSITTTGANGVTISGGSTQTITTSGTFALALGNITPTSISTGTGSFSGDVEFAASIKSPSGSNSPIVISPDGTGDLHVNADSLRLGDNNADATIATNGTGDLILTTHEGSATQGIIRLYDGANGNITLTPNGTGQVQVGSDQVVTLTASQTLTNKTLSTSSTWNGNTIGVAYGGTGSTTLTSGSYVVGNGTSAVTLKTPTQVTADLDTFTYQIGATAGKKGLVPAAPAIGGSVVYLDQTGSWTTPSGGGTTTNALTIQSPLTGTSFNGSTAVTIGLGTVAVGNGGTGLTSLTAGYIPYGSGTSAFGSSANLFWDSTNSRLGLGITTPSATLHLQGSSPYIWIYNDDETDSGIKFGDTQNTGERFQVVYDSAVAALKFVHVNDTASTLAERMRITSSGQLVLGNGDAVASPTGGTFRATDGSGTDIAGASLTIQGGRGTGTGTGGSIIFNTAPAAGTTGSSLNSPSERMRINQFGSVGIGTSSPSSRLHISDANKAFDNYGNINVFTSDAAAVDKGGAIAFGGANTTGGTSPYVFAKIQGIKEGAANTWNGALLFGTTASNSAITERMRLDSSGNLGIGTTTPAYKLDVNGTLNASGSLTVSGNATFDTNTLFVSSSFDRVGIGTTNPSSKLHIDGNFLRIDQGGANIGYFGNSADLITGAPSGVAIRFNDNALRFACSSTQIAMFDTNGNFGLGSTSPAAKLDVRPSTNNIVLFKSASHSTLTGLGAAITFSRGNDGSTDLAALMGWNNGGLALSARAGITFATGGGVGYSATSQAMTIDTSGNVGLGVTPQSWNSIHKAIQIGGGNYYSIASQNSGSAYGSILWNAYGTGDEAFAYNKTGDKATRFAQQYDFKWFTAPSGTAGSAITFTQVMTLDNSGNLGIGVVPSAWGGSFATTQYKGGFIGSQASGYLYTGQNTYYNGTDWKYINTAAVTMMEQSFGAFVFYRAASGTAGNNVSFSESMRIDSSGNLRVNNAASMPAAHTTGNINCSNDISTGSFLIGVNGSYLGRQSSDGSTILNTGQAAIVFSSGTYGSTTEWARFNSQGLGLGTSSPSLPLHVYNSGAALAYFESTNANGPYVIWRSSGTSIGDVGSGKGISGLGNVTDFMIASRSTYPMILGTNSTERMRITSTEVKATVPFIGNSGTKGFGAVTTTTSTSTPTGGSSGDHYYIY